jgi:hypothetical protein
MFSLLTFGLTAFLLVLTFLFPGTTVTVQTAVPESPVVAPGGSEDTTNSIATATAITGTEPITESLGPAAMVAMSVTIGISRSIEITSPAFLPGGTIPKQYTCDGEGANPALMWSGVPADAKSLALTMEDPDAPSGLFVHWVIFNMPPTLTGLQEGLPKDAKLPDGTIQGLNGRNQPGYTGPCPPSGTHRYFFRIYALDTALNLPETTNRDKLFNAVQGHVIAWGQLYGTYQRSG